MWWTTKGGQIEAATEIGALKHTNGENWRLN